ncbi:MAG: hypothetical protein HDT39_00930 [Lachnospiraceae bacterium]|nr:hypothetical protein [Lachnospiraceae bacterium]
MKFFKLIKYDVINGIFYRIYSYASMMVLGIMFFIDFYLNVNILKEDLALERQGATITNILFYIYEGKKPFKADLISEFVFPVMWIILFLFISYLSLEYPIGNLTGHGMQIITRTTSRREWWISKCIWVIESTLMCFFILYMTLWVLCMVFGIDISLQFSDYVNEKILEMNFVQDVSKNEIILLIFVFPVFTAVTINLIQLCLGMFFKKIYCFAIIAIILFVSTYYNTPIMVGNYAMIKRNILCISNGVTFKQGFIINGIIVVLVVVAGLLKFRKYDILKDEM